jgi:hypothetical protein
LHLEISWICIIAGSSWYSRVLKVLKGAQGCSRVLKGAQGCSRVLKSARKVLKVMKGFGVLGFWGFGVLGFTNINRFSL